MGPCFCHFIFPPALPQESGMVNPNDPDDWELVHDDGFVYKRKKRRMRPIDLARAPPDPVAVSDVEMKERRKRKQKALLQLKDKYETEISLWEQLSNTLKDMEDRNPKDGYQIERQLGGQGFVSHSDSLLSQLLLQVEAQEAIIHDVSQLCEIAESLCSAHEEKSTQQFSDLPIWKSPLELMASLCED